MLIDTRFHYGRSCGMSVMSRLWMLVVAVTALAAEHRGVVKFGGLPLPGATVTASRGDVHVTAISDSQGFYRFADLADGDWKVRVEMQCFAPLERVVHVGRGAIPLPDWEMKVLPWAEIKAEEPVRVAANPVDPGVAAALAKPLGKKPPKGHSAPTAANMSGGFQKLELKQKAPVAATPENGADMADENAQPSEGFLVNGSLNNEAATPFAQPGAFGNFRPRPRSQYSGSLALMLGESGWDARPFSLTGQNTAKPDYSRRTGMASFGGPLRLPGLVMKTPLNFSVHYQWLRNRTASVQTARVPTAAERSGDFSQTSGATVKDPTTGAVLADGKLPASLQSPQALALLSWYPLPNFTSGSKYNFQTARVGNTHQDSLQARMMNIGTKRDSVTGGFASQSARGDSTSLFGFLDTTHSLGMNADVSWTHRFGRSTMASVKVNYSRQSTESTPYFANRVNVSAAAGIAGNNQDPQNWGPPALTFSSGTVALTDGQYSATHNQTAGVNGSVYHNYGNHNIKAGAGWRRMQYNAFGQENPRGTFTFTGTAAGYDLAGFLAGIPDAAAIAYGNSDKYFRAAAYEAYANDDFRVTSNFTLNYGVRWDYNTPVTERYGRLVNLDVAPGFTSVAQVVAGKPTGSLTGRAYPKSLLLPNRGAVEPRVAISWRPLPASSLVVRAGYGIYHDTSVYHSIATRMAQQAPLSTSFQVSNGADAPLTLVNGFRAPSTIANTFAVDPDLRIGYAQIWQLSVQRDLPASLVMTATYLGSKGTRALQQFLPNTEPTGALETCARCPSGFVYLASNGNATRQSAQVQLRRRMRSGFTLQPAYTYSRAIDNASLGGRAQGTAVVAQDWTNLSSERGRSPFDQPHVVTALLQYTSGMGLHGGTRMDGWRGRILKDWTFTNSISAGSGMPQTPVYMSVVAGTGVSGSVRPDFTGADLYAAPAGMHLNPGAVSAPAGGHWGNAGRNSIRGPSQFSLNASVSRTFRITEKYDADFRIEATNALNHVTYERWNVVTTSSQFGLPASANAMRTLQATIRLRF